MRDSENGSQRRDFLKTGLLAAAGTTVLGQRVGTAAAPAEKTIAPSSARFPRESSARPATRCRSWAWGARPWCRLFICAYGVELLPMDERVAMVRHAYDSGIRYFDTARVYGESE